MTHDPAEDSRLKQALFVSSWKRDFAAKYSIDVYSSNATLQEELNSVGWAAAIGGLSVSAATLPAQSTFVVAMKNARFANQIGSALNEESPSRLRIINKDKLLAMGVSESLADRFLDHDSFTPRHDTIIVANLEELGSARGRDVFVKAALVAEGEEEANFFMNTAQTMRGYHEAVSPINEITTSGGFTIAQAANGSALLPFPLDYGVWSERAHQLTSFLRQNYSVQGFNGSFDLWVTGTLSPTAREELTKLGFNITEDIDRRVDFLD